jgi:hypothetical protein
VHEVIQAKESARRKRPLGAKISSDMGFLQRHKNIKNCMGENMKLRRDTKNIVPKLATALEKETARNAMVNQIEDFFNRGGKIQEIKQGATALHFGRTKRQQDDLLAKGKAGAKAMKKTK